jgi:hypothetical protein
VLRLGQGSTGQPSANSSLSAKNGHTSPSLSPSLSPSQGPVTPAGFAGSWSGQVRQLPVDTYHVQVTLRAGATSGTVSYSGAVSCSGGLQVVTATTTKLTLTESITHGKCDNGDVTITHVGSNSIRFRFSSSGPSATGTLNRT